MSKYTLTLSKKKCHHFEMFCSLFIVSLAKMCYCIRTFPEKSIAVLTAILKKYCNTALVTIVTVA